MRNKLLVFIFFSTILGNLQAQFDWSNVFGGGDFGYSKPIGKFSKFAKGGLTWQGHAGYKLTEKIAVGTAYSGTIAGAFDSDLATGVFGINLYGFSTYLVKGWYKFRDKKVSPFVSLGTGLGNIAEPDVEVTVTDSNGNAVTNRTKGSKKTSFAGDAELGLALKRFNIKYGFTFGGKVSDEPMFNQQIAGQLVNYHRITMGYTINF